MSNQTNNPRIGNHMNSFVLEGLVSYEIKRYTTAKKNNPYVVFLLQQRFEATNGKTYTRGFQISCFNPEYVDKLTLTSNQVYVRVTGNVLVDVFTTKEGQKVTKVKLIGNEIEILEDTFLPFINKENGNVEKLTPNADYNASIFSLSGTCELQPLIETSKTGNQYAKLYITQTRKAGANYDEYKRYFSLVTFDKQVINTIKRIGRQFEVAYSGEISTSKSGQYYATNLVVKNATILNETDVPFTTTGEKRVKAVEPEFEPQAKIALDDDDLPF